MHPVLRDVDKNSKKGFLEDEWLKEIKRSQNNAFYPSCQIDFKNKINNEFIMTRGTFYSPLSRSNNKARQDITRTFLFL